MKQKNNDADKHWQRLYRQEAQLLGRIGEALAGVRTPRVTVRLPRDLAEQAVTAWERDYEEAPAKPKPETFEQRVYRHRAGTLGLIGLAISERGKWEQDEVIVDLPAGSIGLAIDAGDDLSIMKRSESSI